MPFNNEGLWTPDETIGQAPLAGLAIGNVGQSYQNFQQAQAARREQALLDMLGASTKAGVDVGASPTSQGFASTMGVGTGEASSLFANTPEQKFRTAYSQMSDEDKNDPDKIDALAMATGYKEQPWMSQQRRNAINQQNADTKAQNAATLQDKARAGATTAIMNSITRSIKEGDKAFKGPRDAYQAAVDQVIAVQGEKLTSKQQDDLNAFAQRQPEVWPEASQIGATVKNTKAGAAKKVAETNKINTLLPGQIELQQTQNDLNRARTAYETAAATAKGVGSDVAIRNAATNYMKAAQQHLANAQKGTDKAAIDAAQRDYEKAQKAVIALGTSKIGKSGPPPTPTPAAKPNPAGLDFGS